MRNFFIPIFIFYFASVQIELLNDRNIDETKRQISRKGISITASEVLLLRSTELSGAFLLNNGCGSVDTPYFSPLKNKYQGSILVANVYSAGNVLQFTSTRPDGLKKGIHPERQGNLTRGAVYGSFQRNISEPNPKSGIKNCYC